jgi:hypothetical protein
MTQPELSPDGEWQWDGENWIPYATPQSTAANDAEENIPDEGEKLTLKERLQAQKTNSETNKKAQLSSVVGELFSQLIEPILEDANKGRELFAVVIDTQDAHLEWTGEDTRIPSKEIIDFFKGLLDDEGMNWGSNKGSFTGHDFEDEEEGLDVWVDAWDDYETEGNLVEITSYLFSVEHAGESTGSWECSRIGESHLRASSGNPSMEHIEEMSGPDECKVFFIRIQ